MKFSPAKLSTAVASASLAGALAVSAAPAAQADMIDRALNALPAGHISCEQAGKYWTNTADYNTKVAQTRAIAASDYRGSQIFSALQRVDEAAHRCGLKGGAAQAPVPHAPAQPGPALPERGYLRYS